MIAPAINRRRRPRVDLTVNDSTNPATMTVDDRLVEVAAILAAGFLRLQGRAAVSAPVSPSADSEESPRNCLDTCRETRLHEHRG